MRILTYLAKTNNQTNYAKHFLVILITVILLIQSALANGTDVVNNSYNTNTVSDSIEVIDRSIVPKYGAFVRYSFNLHTADFRKLPDIPCCSPIFTNGSGSGFIAGLLYDHFLNSNYIVSIRASFGVYDGLLTKEEITTGIVDGKSTEVTFEHQISSKISSIALEPHFGYKINDNLFSYIGFRLAYLTQKEYSQIERIIKPGDRGVFKEEGTRTRNYYSGEIPEASNFHLSLNAGISYELPLLQDTSIILAPELFYSFLVTSIVKDLGWRIHTFGAGVAVKYKKPPPPPPPPPPPILAPYPPYPLPPGKPEISANVKAMQLDSNNNVLNGFDIKIEDFVSYNMRPLLNYIFFDHNSAEIPIRYKRLTQLETKNFNLSKLHSLEVMPTYYHVLNIIGKRLSENPDAKITIIGTNSGIGEEKNNTELSRRRAIAVRDYLNSTWGIQDAQMQISSRNLPKEASNMDEAGGEEENRRVEIVSDNYLLTEPVMTIDTVRQIKSTTLRFIPEINADAGLSQWKLTLNQGNTLLKEFSGASTLPSELKWNISTNSSDAPVSKEPINYVLSARDHFGNSISTPQASIPVFKLTIDQKRKSRIEDREYEYYSLILFDFGKHSLGKEHRRVLDFIKNRIKTNSDVSIYGYTDRIGDELINKRLSEKRAKEVADKLNIKNAKVAGIGEEELLFDNELPEGRFYCRTVKITIETEISNGN